MGNYSYLVTFSNLFERKYFNEHLDEFFVTHPLLSSEHLKYSIFQHSSKFIEIKEGPNFKPYALLTRFPKVKIVKKVKRSKSIKYYQIKGWNCD